MELEAMTRYTSPVNPAVFPHLTVVLLAIGMFFTAWFFVYPSGLAIICIRNSL
uniref:Dolichyl-diphosphooligosaccharide-protein glycosyltransferase subunit TMEM258 n=1 Tax=Myripristis murdjan TaxID=586833 RepID=A0A668AFH3_9TELE